MNLEALATRLQLIFKQGILKVDTEGSGLPTEKTVQEINDKVATEQTLGEIKDKVATEQTLTDLKNTVATENTLSEINGKIVKADTDNVTIKSLPAYDSTNDNLKVDLKADNVGVAKDATLQTTNSKLDDLKNTVATESTLSQINGKIVTVDTSKISDKWDYMVNQGNAYEVGVVMSINGGVTGYFLIANPSNSGKTLYIRQIVIIGKAEGRVNKYVGTYGTDIVVSTAGTAVTPVNKDAGSSNTSVAHVEYGGTYTNNSTKVVSSVIPGGSGFFAQGGHAGVSLAGKLEPGYAYLIGITNDSTATDDFSVLIEWWEE